MAEGVGLERYVEAFEANDVDAAVLRTLKADDLKELGVTSLGHRKKLLEAIATLEGPAARPTATRAEVGPAATAREAERRQLTVLFCDLVGSTELSAQLDPEEMREVLRSYQNTVAGEIARFGGHVAKFMGDGVLAYFGWPKAHEDEAERAVRAGLAIAQSVSHLSSAPANRSPHGSASPPGSWWSAIWSARGRRKSRRWSASRRTSPPVCKHLRSLAAW